METLRELNLVNVGRPVETSSSAAAITLTAACSSPCICIAIPVFCTEDPRSLLVLAFIFLVPDAARLVVPTGPSSHMLSPCPLQDSCLPRCLGSKAGIVISLVTCVLAAYGFNRRPPALLLFSSLCGVLALGPARRFWAYLWAGVAVTGAGIAMLAAFRISAGDLDWITG